MTIAEIIAGVSIILALLGIIGLPTDFGDYAGVPEHEIETCEKCHKTFQDTVPTEPRDILTVENLRRIIQTDTERFIAEKRHAEIAKTCVPCHPGLTDTGYPALAPDGAPAREEKK